MRISVVGLGQMGSAIAERLLDAGHDVGVWNRSAERAAPLVSRGARRIESLDLVWSVSDACVTMLSDSTALADVLLEGRDALASDPRGSGKLLIDMSTVAPSMSERVAAVAGATGIRFLRAPVSGNPGVVRAGNLTVVVSGASADFEAASSMLRDIGPHVFYVGSAEAARIVKIALNLVIAGTAELLAECIVLAEANGVERAAMLEVVGASAVGSPFVKYKTPQLVENDFSSTFSTRLMHKDVSLALDAGSASGVPLPVTSLVSQLLVGTMSSGMADEDFTALLIRLEREAGLLKQLV